MPIRIISTHAGEIDLSPAPPPALKPLQVPDSVCWGAVGPFGHLLFQQMDGEGISIRYNTLYFAEEDELTYSSDEPALRLQVALRNSFYYETAGLGKGVLHERGLTLYYVPAIQHQLRVHKQETYSNLSIYYQPDHLLALQNSFPGLPEFLEKARAGQPVRFNDFYCIAGVPLVLLIGNILDCAFTGSLRRAYLNSVAMEILVLALVRMAGSRPLATTPLSERNATRVYHAKELLLQDMEKPLSLPELAARTGLSAFKLNNGFKAIYGMGVMEWQHEARMQKAHHLLQETNEPVSQVAKSSGYSHLNAFCLAFKKYFGYTPAFVQKNGKRRGGQEPSYQQER